MTEATSCVDSTVGVVCCIGHTVSGFCFSFHQFDISGILSDTRSCSGLLIRQSNGDAATYVHPAGAVVGAGQLLLLQRMSNVVYPDLTIAQDGLLKPKDIRRY